MRAIAARRASSTAKKRRSPRCSGSRSRPATSSSSATKGRAAARACARCSASPRAIVGAGLGDSVALVTDGRFSGATRGFMRRPRRARSVARRADCRRPRRRHRSSIDVDDAQARRRGLRRETSQQRLAAWTAPAPRYTTGVFAKYARLVSSASTGAVTGSSDAGRAADVTPTAAGVAFDEAAIWN